MCTLAVYGCAALVLISQCSHRVDKVTPIEKTMEALVELKKYVALPVYQLR
jgi:hypothetical protein